MPPRYEIRYPIRTKELTKSFGKENEIVAVDSLTLQVGASEIFGFVGPNGAGKTTTMKMLIGLLEPSSGSGRVAGYDIVREVIRIREVTGVLPEPAGYYDNLTARQNLRFYGKLYDIEENVERRESLSCSSSLDWDMPSIRRSAASRQACSSGSVWLRH